MRNYEVEALADAIEKKITEGDWGA